MTVHVFAVNPDCGPALGRFACRVGNAYHEMVLAVVELAEVGCEPTKALAALVADLGEAVADAVALADDHAACAAAGSIPILTDDGSPPWVDAEMFARVAAKPAETLAMQEGWHAERNRRLALATARRSGAGYGS